MQSVCCEPYFRDVGDGLINAVNRLHRYNLVEILREPVLLRCRFHTIIDALCPFIASHLAIGIKQRFYRRAHILIGRFLVHQQGLRRTTDTGAPQLRIDDDRNGIVQIGATIEVDVTDALKMSEYGHACFVLYASDQALAAARYDDIQRPAEPAQHFADGCAVRRWHQLNAGLR